MNSTYLVRPATVGDLPQIVQAHIAAFPGFFLTLMGPRFLRLLYQGFMSHPSGICLVACPVHKPSEVQGFVAGTLAPQGFFRQLLQSQWQKFLLASLWPLLRHPGLVLVKLWSALFYRGETLPDQPHSALLSSLGVCPSMQGTGLGRQLVLEFLKHAKVAGAPSVYLTTDQAGNDKANRFYTGLGFQPAGSCKRPGNRILNRYFIELTS